MNISSLMGSLVLLATVPAFADGQFKLEPSASTLTYKIVHKFHEAEGKTSKLDGVAVIKGDSAIVQVRGDVGSFDSGNGGRDAHMKETVEASKFPSVTLKGQIKGFAMPASFPGDVKGNLEAEVDFHGEKKPYTVPISIHFDSATHAHAKAEFDVSLDGHKVERPSMMLIKIDDACHITADVDFVSK
jgi:hypothetical protein